MTKPVEINHNKSDVDHRDERAIQLSGRRIATVNHGNISPRWVDIMPQVAGPSLLCPGRAEQRLARWRMTHPGQECGRMDPVQRDIEPRVIGARSPVAKRSSDYYQKNREKVLQRHRDRRVARKAEGK